MEIGEVKVVSNAKKVKENFIALSVMLSLPLLNSFYILLNTSKRGSYSLATGIDNQIPLVKIFIIPYIAWNAFIFLTFIFLCIRDKRTYYRTLFSYEIGLVICYITYLIFQTTVPRPEIVGNDILSKLIRIIYSNDQPFNCFPSIHVLSSYLMIRAINVSKLKSKFNSIFYPVSAAIIILSTFFVKQHVILDAVSGIFLAEIIFRVVFAVDWERVLLWIKKQYALLFLKKKLEVSYKE